MRGIFKSGHTNALQIKHVSITAAIPIVLIVLATVFHSASKFQGLGPQFQGQGQGQDQDQGIRGLGDQNYEVGFETIGTVTQNYANFDYSGYFSHVCKTSSPASYLCQNDTHGSSLLRRANFVCCFACKLMSEWHRMPVLGYKCTVNEARQFCVLSIHPVLGMQAQK